MSDLRRRISLGTPNDEIFGSQKIDMTMPRSQKPKETTYMQQYMNNERRREKVVKDGQMTRSAQIDHEGELNAERFMSGFAFGAACAAAEGRLRNLHRKELAHVADGLEKDMQRR